MKHLFVALAVVALLFSAAPASAGEGVRCIPVTLTVNTNHQGVEVLMGMKKGINGMDSYGVSPATIRFLAVVADVPGEKKPVLCLLPHGEECPGDDADFKSMPSVARYFFIEPGAHRVQHAGRRQVGWSSARDIRTPKEIKKRTPIAVSFFSLADISGCGESGDSGGKLCG